jgi:hypothetical protein
MHHRLLNTTVVFLISFLIFSGCAKDEPEPEDPGGTTTTGSTLGNFTWSISGNPNVTADSSRYIPAFSNIVAYKGNSSVDIVLSALSVGSYSISSSQGNTLEYHTGSSTYFGTTGTVTITSNTGSKISGNFSSALTNCISISGQFSDVPKR